MKIHSFAVSLIVLAVFSVNLISCAIPSASPTLTPLAKQTPTLVISSQTLAPTPSPESLLPQEVKEKFDMAGIEMADMENAEYDKDGLHITLSSGEVIVLTNDQLAKGIYNGQDNVLQYRDEANQNVIYAFDKETGNWGVASLSIDNLDAKKWGNYSLIENPDGYYEMKDVQGNLIPEVKLFRDGIAELTYSSKKLAIAFQAVSIGKEGQLALGLWDYQNGEWSMAPGYTAEDVRAGEFADDYHKLVVIRGNDEIQKKLTDTIFMARDLYMNNTEGYRPESEFEDISVTVNFKTIDDFDVRPKEWQMNNFSRNFKVFGKTGVYRFSPSSMSNEVVYNDGSTLSHARPQQVGLGNGWFNVERHDAENNLEDSLVHVPVVSMNTDGSINNMGALVKESDLPRLIPFLNKEDRGGIDIWLFSKTVGQMPAVILSDTELMSFTSEINNRNFFDVIDEPKLDTHHTLKSLPKESSQAFFTLIIQTWY